MNYRKEWKPLTGMVIVFLFCYYLPFKYFPFDNFITDALYLVKWYAREHVILCLVPAFFIAGAVSVFISRNSVMKYLGARANKITAYCVASVSGSILAVCSCTILPLFAGIYRMGAGIGPATAFLYSGPAINILAIILTARILGMSLGIARAIGAILFSIIIGLLMQLIFRNENNQTDKPEVTIPNEEKTRPLWQTTTYFALMIGILVFANWGKPGGDTGVWYTIYHMKWYITGALSLLFGIILVIWFAIRWWKVLLALIPAALLGLILRDIPLVAFTAGVVGLSVITITTKGESEEWFSSSWDLAKQILPLLLLGIIIAGALLGRPDGDGLIPSEWISSGLGGNGIGANILASVAGAFMYFATLTEVPILEGLMANGMGKGPALALLLAGPAVSLPNLLVIRSVMGTKKTMVFLILVVIMATIAGKIYGAIF